MRIVAITIAVSLLAVGGWYLAASSSSEADSAPSSSHATRPVAPTTTVAPSTTTVAPSTTTAAPPATTEPANGAPPAELNRGQQLAVTQIARQMNSVLGRYVDWQRGCLNAGSRAEVVQCYDSAYNSLARKVDAARPRIDQLQVAAGNSGCTWRLEVWGSADGALLRFVELAQIADKGPNQQGKLGNIHALENDFRYERGRAKDAVEWCGPPEPLTAEQKALIRHLAVQTNRWMTSFISWQTRCLEAGSRAKVVQCYDDHQLRLRRQIDSVPPRAGPIQLIADDDCAGRLQSWTISGGPLDQFYVQALLAHERPNAEGKAGDIAAMKAVRALARKAAAAAIAGCT